MSPVLLEHNLATLSMQYEGTLDLAIHTRQDA